MGCCAAKISYKLTVPKVKITVNKSDLNLLNN